MIFSVFGGAGRAAWSLGRMAHNVPRVYEPAVRARRLRSCSSASGVTELMVAESPPTTNGRRRA